jgi:hypothetical protein
MIKTVEMTNFLVQFIKYCKAKGLYLNSSRNPMSFEPTFSFLIIGITESKVQKFNRKIQPQ